MLNMVGLNGSAAAIGHTRGFLLQVLDALPAAAYTCDLAGLITYFNRSASDVWGREPRINDPTDRYCGSYRLFFADGRPMRHDQCWMARALQDRTPYNGREVVIERPDGTFRSALSHANPLLDAQGEPIGAANVLVDITDRKQFEDVLTYQATHDALTGMPNRAFLLGELEATIAESGRYGEPFALLLLDLNRFKEINDTFGHEYGDEVLRQVRPKFEACVGKGETVARLGGDEFGVLLPGCGTTRAVRVAEKFVESLREPAEVFGRQFDVSVSVGVAVYPSHGSDATTLLRHADLAMYAAKGAGRGPVLYQDRQSRTALRELSLCGDLRRAIRDDELTLDYQPMVELRGHRVVGVEALVRWRHPTAGVIPPDEFLPVAAKAGLSQALDLWVLKAAMAQGAAWRAVGLALNVAVNLAPASIQDSATVDEIVALLGAPGARPDLLTLEVTERAVMNTRGRVRDDLARLHDLGAGVALDDFGTGYSSLTHLRDLPVCQVKVDRSFVSDLTPQGRDACIVRSVIDLGHNLGLTVVAEGVERPGALELLENWGCDLAQGYYFSRPVPPADFLDWLNAPAGRPGAEPPPRAPAGVVMMNGFTQINK